MAIRARQNGIPLYYTKRPPYIVRRNGRDDIVERIKRTDPITILPLWGDYSSGLARDLSGNGFHGTPTDVEFGVPGIGDGRTAASFNGTSSVVTLPHVALRAVFNTAKGSLLMWMLKDDWSNLNVGWIAMGVNASNYVIFHTGGTVKQARLTYTAGGTFKAAADNVGRAGWNSYLLTWDTVADEIIGYANNVVISTVNGLGVWVGDLNWAFIGYGNNPLTGQAYLDGDAAHVALYDKVLTDAERKSVSVR